MKLKKVFPIALATIMLLAVVSSAGVVTAKGPTVALTPKEQLIFFIASLYKFWQSKMNPTLPGQIPIGTPIALLIYGILGLTD
jgi:hypothetical protein